MQIHYERPIPIAGARLAMDAAAPAPLSDHAHNLMTSAQILAKLGFDHPACGELAEKLAALPGKLGAKQRRPQATQDQDDTAGVGGAEPDPALYTPMLEDAAARLGYSVNADRERPPPVPRPSGFDERHPHARRIKKV